MEILSDLPKPIDTGEEIARIATRIAEIQRGLQPTEEEIKRDKNRSLLLYMYSIKLKHLADIQFKESFTNERM